MANCKEIFCANEKEGKNDICSSCRLKKWRKDNPEKVKAYARMRYKRDREKILEAAKAHHKKNNYTYFKSGKPKENNLIRRKTRLKYPLKGNMCEYCDTAAEQRHHITEPITIDDFIFLCKKHHKEIEDKKRLNDVEEVVTE